VAQRFNLSSYTSPKKGARSSSLCTIKKESKYASTPKSERRIEYRKKIREMLDQNSISMQRNMSNNWADIVEELDEQAKEVETYVKFCVKFYQYRFKDMSNVNSDESDSNCDALLNS